MKTPEKAPIHYYANVQNSCVARNALLNLNCYAWKQSSPKKKNPPFCTNIDRLHCSCPLRSLNTFTWNRAVKWAHDSDSQLDGAAMTRTAYRTTRGLGQQPQIKLSPRSHLMKQVIDRFCSVLLVKALVRQLKTFVHCLPFAKFL